MYRQIALNFCYIGWRHIDDGDCVSCKACWTKESNEDAERYINSNAYVLSSTGDTMRSMSQGFVMTQYLMTMLDKDSPVKVDCNNNTRSKYYTV